MKQYLLSINMSYEGAPSEAELAPVMAELAQLNAEMQAAGAWVFAGGLHPPTTATVLRAQDGVVVTTDGPFAEGKEVLGGFTVIRASDLDEALGWGRKLAAILTPLAIEVRPFDGEAEA
ncbi:YciI family protein [Tenggerimyces flavus]|uniref:YciI family protein n=1 Tax=Tenggerimyces flavus TaxID=1708749 RepID=A0ABV7YA95_9ACTN|nr:YciI family protein [Tenggerimyces flavus]MBM7789082.1 hypothetical protein [Tenggerimyces flavus]